VVYLSDFLAADREVPGSILGAARFSKQWFWNGVHSALVRINEELLERKVAAPVYKTEINDRVGPAVLSTQHTSIHKIGTKFRRQVAVVSRYISLSD
jgi:hypothetical protein